MRNKAKESFAHDTNNKNSVIMIENCHSLSKDKVLSLLDSNEQSGLTEKEAKKRLKLYGPNALPSPSKDSFFKKFGRQFQDFMILTLLFAALLSLGLAIWEGNHDYAEPIIILAIVFINALIGTLQEEKAERAVASLKSLVTHSVTVLRNKKHFQIDFKELVPGDIISLRTGETIPADAMLLAGYNISCDESSLTGESLPCEKRPGRIKTDTPLAERNNMVYSGTIVNRGHGSAVVVATGTQTQMGHIAKMLHEDKAPKTPLQKQLEKTGKLLGLTAFSICIVIFLIGILQKQDIFFMFMTSISLAVAAIPEGLPAIVTVLLSVGVLHLAKKNTIIRNLPAVETLGSATVICSDKTGTLTQNRMQVKKCFTPSHLTDSDTRQKGEHPKSSQDMQFLMQCCLLCNNSCYDEKHHTYIGEPTENALFAYAKKGLPKKLASLPSMRLKELPFDSVNKYMSTLHQKDGAYLQITKGAPERILALCDSYLDGSEQKPLTPSIKRRIEKANEDFAHDAYRTIAFACKKHETVPANLQVSGNMVYVGLLGLADPPRAEVKQAIQTCKKAHITTMMITGDQAATAKGIAKEIGLTKRDDALCTGKELDALSDRELTKKINHYRIFARVEPRHKVRIVKALQNNGHIVAMTGDGVNDAPALKAADIGCAMGKSGTDAARNAADLLLLDDNFATIVLAIREGRGIFLNIRRTIHFLLSCNIGEILVIFLSILMTGTTPLLPIHLLWVNLITDSLPALALGMEPVPKDIMYGAAHSKKQTLLGVSDMSKICLEGCVIGTLALLAYTMGIHGCLGVHPAAASTLCFCVLCFSQLVHALNLRSDKSIFRLHPFSNPYLLFGLLCCIGAQSVIIFIPGLAAYFKTCVLSATEWFVVIALSLQPLLLMELQKFTLHSFRK